MIDTSKGGQKIKTAENTPPGTKIKRIIRHEAWEPTSPLDETAQQEFDRLCLVLDGRGTLEQIDLNVITSAARVKALMDYVFTANDTELILKLMPQLRGLYREMGLTITPSRSVLKSVPKSTEADPLEKMIKIA